MSVTEPHPGSTSPHRHVKLIDKINQHIEDKTVFFSLEYFPPKTPSGIKNLYSRLDAMASLHPAWIDVTWGAGGTTSETTLEICIAAQNYIGLNTMMHLTCTNIDKGKVLHALEQAKKGGIENILALRGDPPRGEIWTKTEDGFERGLDLVKFIRTTYGDHFGICVAGYPESHPDSPDRDKDLHFLKEKIDAGADFVITQLFYDTDIFLQFVKDCRAIGITCPILPGMMPIQTYAGFKRMTTLCKTSVPQYISDALEPIQNDDAAVKAYGVKLCIEMCKKLLDNGIPGLHFYTLNLEKSVVQILEGLNLVQKQASIRQFPWRASAASNRKHKEEVRPIFWSNRPSSYMSRTCSWDDFPNGRWGDSRSPAYGEPQDYHLTSSHGLRKKDRLTLWGAAPKVHQDIYNVFAAFCKGQISHLPWNDIPLSPETESISPSLVKLNLNGFLTINSQPSVNAASSDDLKYGWGGSGGYVYQKPYVEFFTSPENHKALLIELQNHPMLSYVSTNLKGESSSNLKCPCAVTWGVFPGKEIIQPTVVDPDAFLVWKDEAFGLWRAQWAKIYDVDSPSYKLITEIADTFYLVAVVENNYLSGNIFALFDRLIGNRTEAEVKTPQDSS